MAPASGPGRSRALQTSRATFGPKLRGTLLLPLRTAFMDAEAGRLDQLPIAERTAADLVFACNGIIEPSTLESRQDGRRCSEIGTRSAA